MMHPKPYTIVCHDIRSLHHRAQTRCTLRTHQCTWEATDFCHVRTKLSLGGNRKPPDLHGFYACRACHQLQEARRVPWEDVMLAVFESQMIMIEEGLLHVGSN